MLRKREIILVKEESTYGVDSTPTENLNAVLAFTPQVTPVGEIFEREPIRGTLSRFASLVGARSRQITFQTELRGSGSLGVAPRTGDLFEACGMLETIVATTSVKYTPASSSLKSVTIYAYIDGLLYKLLGCVGSWEIVCEMGKPAMISWTFQGLYNAPADAALPTAPVFDSPTPPQCLSSNFIFNAVTTFVVQQLSLVLGNSTGQRDDINAVDGIKGFVVTGRKGSGSFNPEAVLTATYDFEGDWKSAAQRALEITLGTAGNRVKLSAPKVQIDVPAHADRNEIFTFDIPFFLAMDQGDDEVAIFID